MSLGPNAQHALNSLTQGIQNHIINPVKNDYSALVNLFHPITGPHQNTPPQATPRIVIPGQQSSQQPVQPAATPTASFFGMVKPTRSASQPTNLSTGPVSSGVVTPITGKINTGRTLGPTQAPKPQQSPAITIDKFLDAIGNQESQGTGGYYAKNPDTGAIGKYQILPSNWKSWAKAAGLPVNAEPTPKNQELVARTQINALYKKYGNWKDVASVWYSGRPLSSVNQNVKQGNYPSIKAYVDSVLQKASN